MALDTPRLVGVGQGDGRAAAQHIGQRDVTAGGFAMALDTPQLTSSTEELKMMRDTWDRNLLDRAKYELVHALFGSTAYVPANSDAPSGGSAYKWFRPEPILIAPA